jgi:hypothetical protein
MGLYSQQGRIFSSPQRSDRFWVPPSLLSIGYRGYCLSVKPLVCEASQLAIHFHVVYKFMNEWRYSSNSPYISMAWYLVKYEEQLYILSLVLISTCGHFNLII